MKSFHRLFLWVLGLIMPVFIAACYGMPYGFSKTGRVLDSKSRQGISGLKVICVENGSEWNYDYSTSDGSFMLPYDVPCDAVKVVDIDGPDNGQYQEKDVPFCTECQELEIEVEPAN